VQKFEEKIDVREYACARYCNWTHDDCKFAHLVIFIIIILFKYSYLQLFRKTTEDDLARDEFSKIVRVAFQQKHSDIDALMYKYAGNYETINFGIFCVINFKCFF
jgi:hypothetical protein